MVNQQRPRPQGRKPQRPRRAQRRLRRKPGARQAQDNRSGQQQIGAAVTSMNSARASNSIRVTGNDSITLIPNILDVAKESGDVISNIRVIPSASKRLGLLAACYQEIKYNSLRARINGAASSLTVGSGLLSFCADPADEIPSGGEAVRWGRSQACQVAGKYWETLNLDIPHAHMRGPNDGYFKNNAGTDSAPRTYSPGFISYLAISVPSSDTPLEIELVWDVTLRNPTLNQEVTEGPQISEAIVAFGVVSSNSEAEPYNPRLGAFIDGIVRDLLPTDFSPPLQRNTYYQLPGGQLTMTGNSSSPASVVVTHLACGNGGTDQSYITLYRYLVSSEIFTEFTLLNFPTQPSPLGAPTFRAQSEWEVDLDSPSLDSGLVGFQAASHLRSRSRRSHSNRSPRARTPLTRF